MVCCDCVSVNNSGGGGVVQQLFSRGKVCDCFKRHALEALLSKHPPAFPATPSKGYLQRGGGGDGDARHRRNERAPRLSVLCS